MAFQHGWNNNSSGFVSRHARIQEFSSGVGGPGPSVIKIPDNVFIVLFLVVLPLFYRMPMVYFKENYNFPRFQRGSNIFSRGGSTFSRGGGGGVQLLIPYWIPYNLSFSRGVRAPCPPLCISACNILLWKKLTMRKCYQSWPPPLGIPKCIHGVWENNHSGLTRIQIVFEFFNGSTVTQW